MSNETELNDFLPGDPMPGQNNALANFMKQQQQQQAQAQSGRGASVGIGRGGAGGAAEKVGATLPARVDYSADAMEARAKAAAAARQAAMQRAEEEEMERLRALAMAPPAGPPFLERYSYIAAWVCLLLAAIFILYYLYKSRNVVGGASL